MAIVKTIIVVAIVGAAVIVGGSIAYTYVKTQKIELNPMKTVPTMITGIRTATGL